MFLPLNKKPPELYVSQILTMIEDLYTNDVVINNQQIIFPQGTGKTKIMIIESTPNVLIEEEGEPLISTSSNKFFLNTLENQNLELEDIYLTSINKIHPKNEPNPNEHEVSVIMAELVNQNPNIVVSLGEHALDFFLPAKDLKDVNGEVQEIVLYPGKTINLLPLTHPFETVDNPTLLNEFLEGFGKIKEFVQQNKVIKSKQIDTPELVKKVVKQERVTIKEIVPGEIPIYEDNSSLF